MVKSGLEIYFFWNSKSQRYLPTLQAHQFSLSGQIFFVCAQYDKEMLPLFSLCFLFFRFYGFRRLNYNTKNGKLGVSGFCDPHSKEDVTADDAEMWEATADNAPDGLSVDQAKYVTPFFVFLSLC